MSLLPATNPIRASIKTALNGEFPYDDLFIRSIETLTIGTGALTQNFAVVAAGERRPLIHTKIVVASGQFLSDATFTLQNANHVVGDLVTIEFIPGDFPAGRTLTVKDSAGLTLATATNASTSSPINFTLNSDNTWLVTDAIADVLPQDLSTTATPTFAAVNLQGAAGVGFVNLKAQSSDPAAPASNNIRLFANSANKFAWIGSSGFVRNFDGTLTASRSYTLPDANSSIPVFGQTITFAGPTAARTVTLPDAAFTVARTDSGNTFTGAQTIGGNITFGTSASVLNGTTGSIGLTAIGTNQSITLTPSGTGQVVVAGSRNGALVQINNDSNNGGIQFSRTGSNPGNSLWQVTSNGGAQFTADSDFSIGSTSVGNALSIISSGAVANTLVIKNGHVLLGGLTTDGTGVLQLPTATTSAGGITMGTDIQFFRTGAGTAQIAAATGLTVNGPLYGTSDIQAGAANALFFANRTILKSPSDGVLTLANNANAGFSTVQYGPPASATSRVTLQKAVTAIANNTATDILTVTIPNAAHSARIALHLDGSLGAGGSIGANEASQAISYDLVVTRVAGVNATCALSSAYGSASTAVSGAATANVTATLTAVSGAVGASNTFTVQVTVARSAGSSANHTCQLVAEILNANATGITIA